VKAKPPAKLENVNDEPNVAQSPLPRSGSVQQFAAGNSRCPCQLRLIYEFVRHIFIFTSRSAAVPELWTLGRFSTMKTSEDFSIAKLLKGSLLGLLGVTLPFCSLYIGFHGGSLVLCGFLFVGGMVAIGLSTWMVCRCFRRT
jgi:hypothetical protein